MPFLHTNRRRRCPRLVADSATRSVLNGYRPLVVPSPNTRYAGRWANGQKSGFGSETSSRSGWVYEGNFRANLRHGFGTLRRPLSNGNYRSIYVGEWLDGRRHGDGKQWYTNGSTYWGQWQNGVRSGLGISWMDEGCAAYVGEWRDDRYDGAGVLFQANRNRYEGMFRAGLKHGEGTFYHLHTGQVQKGMWVDDQSVTSIMQDELRSTSMRPTPYPMPRNQLQDPDKVVHDSFRHVMDFIRGQIPPTKKTASRCPYRDSQDDDDDNDGKTTILSI